VVTVVAIILAVAMTVVAIAAVMIPAIKAAISSHLLKKDLSIFGEVFLNPLRAHV
jgi:hypothetical protein